MADWICVCGYLNSDKVSECNRCQTSRSKAGQLKASAAQESKEAWSSTLQDRLSSGEQLLGVVTDLFFSILFVPYVSPKGEYNTELEGVLALTDRRLIAVWHEGKGFKWFHIPALYSFSERTPDKPQWLYQAVVMLPGGIGFVVRPKTSNLEQATKLASLLLDAFMRFAVRNAEDSNIAAIIAHEEKIRQRKEEERKRREQE